MGAGLGLALSSVGNEVTHLVRSDRPAPPGAGLSIGESEWHRAVAGSSIVIIATPDAAIAHAAASLRALTSIRPSHIVLHLSGLHDRSALESLAGTGAALGSLHPLQAVSDPHAAPARLRGAWAGIEGDERAVACADRLSRAVGMVPVRLPPGSKAGYHAAAAITSNLTVALYAVATRVAGAAGIDRDAVERMYLGLLRGTVENLAAGGPEGALTGAIRRGDVETVRAHLRVLAPADREIYRVLGREALRVARNAGLPDAAAAAVSEALADER
jgi:predicted short-subunit dehydrogenase-like oxidoreductase (DUF2520 family)